MINDVKFPFYFLLGCEEENFCFAFMIKYLA